MIRRSSPLPPSPDLRGIVIRGEPPGRPNGRQTAYGREFWTAYVANLLLVVAVALLFRYADFVTLLGGTEFNLGWIVGAGAVGSLMMRLLLGAAIDQYGPRLIWLGSLVLFVAVCFAHLAVTSCHGPAIFLLRIAFCSAVAGVFGASMTLISGRVSVERMAEMIGMLGTSGFVGFVLGTQLGDLICGTQYIERWQIDRMFIVAGVLGGCAILFAWLTTRGLPRPPRRKRPPMVWLLRRYHPGTVLLVGVAGSVGLGLPAVFLRTYAAELGIARIGWFFVVFSTTAVATRILTRRLSQRIGLEPIIIAGMAGLALSQFLFLLVRSEWQLMIPALGYGVSHAVFWPAVIAAGSRSFPTRHRGLGTTFILATSDVGQLVGTPAIGAILHYSGILGLPSYPTMFMSVAAVLATVGIYYWLSQRRTKPPPPKVLPLRGKRFAELEAQQLLAKVGPDA